MDVAVSPLAPRVAPEMPAVDGVRLGALASGIRYKGRPDLMMMELDPGTTVAGVFTRSKTAAAPVLWCRSASTKGRARALVVNAGIANAFTGAAGLSAVQKTVEAAVSVVGCRSHEVFVCSTGTIGEPLPADKIEKGLPKLHPKLAPDGWSDAAHAIMTTDTYPKMASRTAEIDGVTVTINGIAKGSGMIAPDLATMLCFVATDAALPAEVAQELLKRGADRSFNCITVDSDTSTSDSLLLFATGKAKHKKVKGPGDKRLKDFRTKLNDLLLDLSHQVVRDGEGATKFVEIRVTGAESGKSARKIGKAIANSPLVKTAVAGEDANWGRIVAAVGKAGEPADRDRLAIRIGGTDVARQGERVAGYDEAPVAAHMKTQEILIEVDVGIGKGHATVWTCDLTHTYISINADYRT